MQNQLLCSKNAPALSLCLAISAEFTRSLELTRSHDNSMLGSIPHSTWRLYHGYVVLSHSLHRKLQWAFHPDLKVPEIIEMPVRIK